MTATRTTLGDIPVYDDDRLDVGAMIGFEGGLFMHPFDVFALRHGTDYAARLDAVAAWVSDRAGRRAAVLLDRLQEPAEERRERILAASPETRPWEYDLAVDLGYEPESWDGMWKLTREPFSYRHGCVIAREVVSPPTETENRITRLVAHRLPAGWNLVEESGFASSTPTVHFVSPADQAWLRLLAETGVPPTTIMVTNALAEDS